MFPALPSQPRDTQYYNPYFPGGWIGMPQPINEGAVEYEDGTSPTVTQMAKDVCVFLTWAAEPEADERKLMGGPLPCPLPVALLPTPLPSPLSHPFFTLFPPLLTPFPTPHPRRPRPTRLHYQAQDTHRCTFPSLSQLLLIFPRLVASALHHAPHLP